MTVVRVRTTQREDEQLVVHVRRTQREDGHSVVHVRRIKQHVLIEDSNKLRIYFNH